LSTLNASQQRIKLVHPDGHYKALANDSYCMENEHHPACAVSCFNLPVMSPLAEFETLCRAWVL
jgi:hypothetical protein